MKISLITAVYNCHSTIESTLESVFKQEAEDVEYIVVDGMSNDGTSDVIAANEDRITTSIREKDNGIYDAMNKGLGAATGDVVGFIHADDFLSSPTALRSVETKFASGDFDAVYADLQYVSPADPDRVVRHWKSGDYDVARFRRGWMPPHPTVYVRRSVYEEFGKYLTDFGSAADYECMVRLMVKHKIRVGYIPEVLVKMRTGGESNASLANRLVANDLDRQAWAINGLKPPRFLKLTKPLRKLPQYWRRG